MRDVQPARLGKAEVITAYRRLARRYDVWAALTESRARRRCLEFADLRDGETVLEVAVGTGILFRELLERNPSGKTEGIDLTNEMLEEAKRKAAATSTGNYRLTVGDAYDLQYPDDSFDLVINNFMFDLLPEEDFPAVLAEFRRVLRGGGRLVLANMTTPLRWYQGLWELLYGVSPKLMGGCRGVRLSPHIVAAGFGNVQREVVSQLTFPCEVVRAVKP